jgi:VWFA-related protein
MGSKPDAAADSSTSDAAAQQGPEEVGEGDVLRVDTSLVTVPVSVLDRQGRFISNLKQDDLCIFENGVEQSIAYFERRVFVHRRLILDALLRPAHLEDIREAAIAFAKQLRPQDRVLIVSFSDEVLLLTEATNDLNLVETVIDDNVNPGNSTRLYDAVDLTIRERMNKIKGRKAIVLFTDGVDTSSQQATYHTTLSEVEELAALIYPIQYDTSDYMNAMQGNGTVTVTTSSEGVRHRHSTQTHNAPMNNGVAIRASGPCLPIDGMLWLIKLADVLSANVRRTGRREKSCAANTVSAITPRPKRWPVRTGVVKSELK